MRKNAYFWFFLLVAATVAPYAVHSEKQQPPQTQALKKENSENELPKELAKELKEAEEAGSPFLKRFKDMLLTLGGTIFFLILLMWILKRMLATRVDVTNRKSAIKVLEQRTLSQKTTLYILGIYGKAVAVAESANGLTKLTEASQKEVEKATFKELINEKRVEDSQSSE